jgi:hypothetical protein
MAEMSVKSIISAYEKAKADKCVTEATWEDLIKYAMPRKRGIQTTYQPGDKPDTTIYDDTAVQANLILAAGLSGYMTNAAQRWFELRSRDEALMNDSGVAEFFSKASESMYSVLNNSNFYQQIHEVYVDLGSVGTAGIYEDDDLKDVVRFYTRHPRELFIVEDDREEVNMVFRKFTMGAYQAYKFFGAENVGQAVVKAVDEEKDYNKPFEFIHHVCPRNKRDPRKIDNKNKPFASYWVSLADKKMVREGGYEEFPYFCPRFYKNSGETYGYSPTYTCFPSIERLNNATELYEAAAYQDAYPPWLAEQDGIMGTLDLRRDAINYQRQPLSQGQAIASLKHDRNIQVGIDYMERQTQKIQKAFFVDLFLMLAQQTPNMTATEVIERSQEKMLILGPVLGRLQTELLNPIIYRTFNIMMRKGLLPQVPQALAGTDWDVVYVSPLAKAQRAVQAKDMQTFLAIIGQMAQFAPSVLDKLDSDKIVDKFGKVYSIDPEVIKSDEDVEESRARQAQAMAQQQQMAMLQQGAALAKDAGSASASFAKSKQEVAK